MAGRTPNEGDGKPLNLTAPAGLYEFLTQHARRAIIGKSQSEVAMYMILQQALAWDEAGFMGIKLPAREFPNPDLG